MSNSARERRWQALWTKAEATTDLANQHIEPVVMEPVVGLWSLGVKTAWSCEGHTKSLPFPWIEVYVPETDRVNADLGDGQLVPDERMEAMTRANLREQKKLLDLLIAFYRRREVPYEVQLALDRPEDEWGAARLCSVGGDTARLLSRRKREEKLRVFQAEMTAFGKFLRRKFFST